MAAVLERLTAIDLYAKDLLDRPTFINGGHIIAHEEKTAWWLVNDLDVSRIIPFYPID